MTTGQKILAGVMVGGVFYLLTKRTKGNEIVVSKQIADRVMGNAGNLLRFGAEQGVDPALAAAVMTVESGGNPNATGVAGEVGLMQILPATAKWIANVEPAGLYDPATNIRVGIAYLRRCVDLKNGNVSAGIASYNYGPGRVQVVSGRVQAPPGVLAYVQNVFALVEPYRRLMRERLGSFYENAFPSGRLILNGLSGVYSPGRPRWGYRYNIEQYAAGRRVPGECPVPPRGIGLRQGTRWLYQ